MIFFFVSINCFIWSSQIFKYFLLFRLFVVPKLSFAADFSMFCKVLDKLLEYKRNWIQHVNRMPRDRLPRIMKHYSPVGRRNRGRPLKRLLDT